MTARVGRVPFGKNFCDFGPVFILDDNRGRSSVQFVICMDPDDH